MPNVDGSLSESSRGVRVMKNGHGVAGLTTIHGVAWDYKGLPAWLGLKLLKIHW